MIHEVGAHRLLCDLSAAVRSVECLWTTKSAAAQVLYCWRASPDASIEMHASKGRPRNTIPPHWPRVARTNPPSAKTASTGIICVSGICGATCLFSTSVYLAYARSWGKMRGYPENPLCSSSSPAETPASLGQFPPTVALQRIIERHAHRLL